MKRHAASHLDHALTEPQIAYLLNLFADRSAFFIETVTLPREFGTVPCGLYGPEVGDPPILESEVSYAKRGERAYDSRLIALPSRPQGEVTVIAGPHEETCPRCNGSRIWYGLSIPPDNGPWECRDCVDGKVNHACILYTAFGGPLAPQEVGELDAQLGKLDGEWHERLRHFVGDVADLIPESDGYVGKRLVLKAKFEASMTFWSQHALSR